MAGNSNQLGAGGGDIRLPKLSHLVATRLRDQIVSGKLKPGSLLLPENKLLEMFKVSRPTLREALRILEAERLISIGRGVRSGATVLGPSAQKAAEYASLILVSEGVTMRDLHEARMFFEPAIVRSLESDAVEAVVSQLRACITDIHDALARREYVEVVIGTNRFHEQLVSASGNKTLALLIGMLRTISDDAYSAIIATDPASNSQALLNNMTKTVSGYVTLCELLEKGKTDEAAAFWRRYMERSLDFLKRSKVGEQRLVQSSAGGVH